MTQHRLSSGGDTVGTIVPIRAKNSQPPGSNDPPPLTSEMLMDEIQQALNEIRSLYWRFGPKLPQLIFRDSIKQLLIPDPSKLKLSCLGDGDCFTCIQKVYFSKSVDQPGERPLLYWLISPIVHFSGQRREHVLLKLKPSTAATTPSGSTPPRLDIELKSMDGNGGIELTFYTDGEFNKREILWACLQETTPRAPANLYGMPVQVESVAMKWDLAGAHVQPGLAAMFKSLFPRPESHWRNAMSACLDCLAKQTIHEKLAEQTILENFAQACQCPDDAVYYKLSTEQDQNCRRLVGLSPPYATEFLKGKIGQRYGPLCYRQMRPDGPKD